MYQRKDAFYVRAKAAGYRSRAAFKLLELARRGRLLHWGDRVVDLGAWPGGWLQVASQLVGPTGKVIGVDIRPVDPLPQKNVMTITGDVADPEVRQQIARVCEGRVDVVLSDLAPKLSGIRARDDAQAEALMESVLQCVEALLKFGGRLALKSFMGVALPQFLEQLQRRFREVRTMRPEATRKGSAELYVVASGFRAPGDRPGRG